MAVTLNELVDIVEKSGLPMIDELKMNTSRPYIEEQIRSVIGEKYAPMFGKLDEDKKAKVEALANVDRQMSQLFGAGGKYQLMNPMATEQLTSGMHSQRMGELGSTLEQQSDLLKQFEGDVGGYATLYDQLLPNKGTGGGNWWDQLNLRIDENGNVVFGATESDWTLENDDWELIPEEQKTENKKLSGVDIISEPIG